MNSFRNLDILVVDDHANMRHIWTTVLDSFGIKRITQAPDAMSALEILNNNEIDIAIIDVVMGDISGQALIRHLRQSEESPNKYLPIIVCTADTRRSCIYSLINAGTDEILTKPVKPTAIWQKLIAVINHRRQFVKTEDYFGPDRRRVNDPNYKGPDRRESLFI